MEYKFIVTMRSDDTDFDSEDFGDHIEDVLRDTLEEGEYIEAHADCSNPDYEDSAAIKAATHHISTYLNILDERFADSALSELVQKSLRTIACGLSDLKGCLRCLRLFAQMEEAQPISIPRDTHCRFTPQNIQHAPQHILIEIATAIATDLDIEPPTIEGRMELIDWIKNKVRGMRRSSAMMN